MQIVANFLFGGVAIQCLPEQLEKYGKDIEMACSQAVMKAKDCCYEATRMRKRFNSEDELMGLLALEDGTHCEQARTLAEAKLADVRSKLAGLRRIERVLRTMIDDCNEREGEVCCPMIKALQSATTH